jgi:hypothetical protein
MNTQRIPIADTGSDLRFPIGIRHEQRLCSPVGAMYCSKRNTRIVLAGCVVWLAGLGWIDRVTGYELGLFAFYTAPVAVVAWHFGRGPGIIMAFFASIIWYVADRLDLLVNPEYQIAIRARPTRIKS